MAKIREIRKSPVRKTVGPTTKVKGQKISTKETIEEWAIIPADVSNYGAIAKGLGIKIGPKITANQFVDSLEKHRINVFNSEPHGDYLKGYFTITRLYVLGYNVEGLYAQLIANIQNEIVKNLPFKPRKKNACKKV